MQSVLVSCLETTTAVLQLAALWGDDASYGVAVRQHMEDLKQVLQQDKQAQSDLNTCDSGDCEDGLTEVASKPKSLMMLIWSSIRRFAKPLKNN